MATRRVTRLHARAAVRNTNRRSNTNSPTPPGTFIRPTRIARAK